MKQAAVVGERQAAVIEVADPKAYADWVVVKVQTAPMCTEYKGFLQGGRAEYLGHEAAGEVVEVAQPGRVKLVIVWWSCRRMLVADVRFVWLVNISTARTAMILWRRTVHALAVPLWPNICSIHWLLVPVPDDVSIDHAALACCGSGANLWRDATNWHHGCGYCDDHWLGASWFGRRDQRGLPRRVCDRGGQ